MTIRKKSFIALWVLIVLAVARIAIVVYSYREGARLDVTQQRVSDEISELGTVWRALTEMKDDQRAFELTGALILPEKRERARRTYSTAIDRLSALATDPVQVDLLARLRSSVAAWTAKWDTVPTTTSTVDRPG